MNRGKGFILALMVAAFTACASGGGGAAGAGEAPTVDANAPQDNAHTRAATLSIVQATASEGEAAQEHYQAALQEALSSIETDPQNAKGYLLAGQAAVGLRDWARADSMLDRAEELYPAYEEQTVADREQGWVDAYSVGVEAANAGDLERALEVFSAAAELYDQRPDAHLMVGWTNMRLGNTEGAIEAYSDALAILYADPPEGLNEEQLEQWYASIQPAALNLAQNLAQNGQPAEAAEVLGTFLERRAGEIDPETELRALTARANFLAQAGEAEAAQALMDEIIARPDLGSDEYFQLGIGFFNAGDYVQAADAFAQAAELNPYNRDALLNMVQSLYSQAVELEEADASPDRDARLGEIYDQILDAAEQVRSFDPLNRNVLSFMLRAYRGQADLVEGAEVQQINQRSQELFRQYQAQPYEVSDISLNLQGDQVALTGVLTNLSGDEGDQVTLRFTAVNSAGQTIDSASVTVTAPAAQESVQFSTDLDLSGGEFAGWRYEVVQ